MWWHNPETCIVIPAVRVGICYRVSLVIPAVEPESSKLLYLDSGTPDRC